jgi:ABC-2 type transport system ATP-binding protein
VILSTHILQEVEAVCSRVLILNEGRIAAQGTPEEIAGTLKGRDTWELVLKGTGIAEKYARLLSGMARFASGTANFASGTAGPASGTEPEIEEDQGEPGIYRVRFFLPSGGQGAATAAGEGIFDWAVAEELKILGMNRRTLSLEDIFVKLTRDEAITEETHGNP